MAVGKLGTCFIFDFWAPRLTTVALSMLCVFQTPCVERKHPFFVTVEGSSVPTHWPIKVDVDRNGLWYYKLIKGKDDTFTVDIGGLFFTSRPTTI